MLCRWKTEVDNSRYWLNCENCAKSKNGRGRVCFFSFRFAKLSATKKLYIYLKAAVIRRRGFFYDMGD